MTTSAIGGSIDVGSIVSQLMAVERQPLSRLQEQQKSYQSKLSAFGQLQSAMSKLQDAATALTKSSTFSATTASAGDTKAFTVSSTASAQTGSYNIEVSQLARAQRTATSATTAPDLSGGGSIDNPNPSWPSRHRSTRSRAATRCRRCPVSGCLSRPTWFMPKRKGRTPDGDLRRTVGRFRRHLSDDVPQDLHPGLPREGQG